LKVFILYAQNQNTFAKFFFYQISNSMLYKTLNIFIDTYSGKVVKA